jgi:benzaldehyde dehydrogenase (NAD)
MQASALEPSRWNGRIFAGAWTEARGGMHDVIEKATGASLGKVGMANPADITAAASAAAAAQPAWAAMPPRDRAAIFRKVIAFFEAHGEEMVHIMVRETGSIPPKSQFEIGEVAASTTPSACRTAWSA